MVYLHLIRSYILQDKDTIFFIQGLHVFCEIYSFVVYGFCCYCEWDPKCIF